MNLASPTTALSPSVKHLICEVGCGELGKSESNTTDEQGCTESESGLRNSSHACQNGPLVLSHGGIDLEHIASLLPTSDDTAEYFQEAVRVLAPVCAQCQHAMGELSTEQIESSLMPRLQWAQSLEIFRDYLGLLGEEEEENARDVLGLLLLSAVLERALGNVYLLKGNQCPSMLKDLLVTEELGHILGHSLIQILRVVIGPPTSLNLRNVAWHGFLGDQELPRRYCCFLVLLVATIGDVLTQKGIHDIPQRAFFLWTPSVKERLAFALNISESGEEIADVQSLTTLLTRCGVIQPQTQQQWTLLFHLYTQGRYGYCLTLLLPLLEHVLRRVFATVNHCLHRVLTAQSSEFYTTFNEMLDQRLADGSPNQLPAFLTTPCMDLLHDLLFYPEGPRVRDHLSHGEVDFGPVDRTIVAPFLQVVVFVALRLHTGGLDTDGEFQVMERLLQSYRSVFHPVAILQHKFAGLLCLLENTELSDLESIQQALSLVLQLEALKRISQQHIPTLFRWQSASGVECNQELLTQLEIETTQAEEGEGAMKESECVGLLLRMSEECSTAAQQTQQTLQQRHQQLLAKQLRSRQRDNLKKLLLCIPCLQILISSVSAFTAWTVQRLHGFTSLTPSQRKKLQKFLKGTLQQCENLRTLTSPDKNKWTESVELLLHWVPACHRFLQDWQLQQHSG